MATLTREQPAAVLTPLKEQAKRTAPDELARVLRSSVRGEVRFDAGSRSLYATDLDFSKYMNRILDLDPTNRFARVQPGALAVAAGASAWISRR